MADEKTVAKKAAKKTHRRFSRSASAPTAEELKANKVEEGDNLRSSSTPKAPRKSARKAPGVTVGKDANGVPVDAYGSQTGVPDEAPARARRSKPTTSEAMKREAAKLLQRASVIANKERLAKAKADVKELERADKELDKLKVATTKQLDKARTVLEREQKIADAAKAAKE